jgi:asparagine synthase (glutamine-hydrolysing)
VSGIVAVVCSGGTPLDRRLLERMTRSMAFRGPDGREIWCGGDEGATGAAAVGLGTALLRTALESVGERQPLTLDGRVWITADVRLDGRSELIRALAESGETPAGTAPDVALVLHAYRAWGERCLDRLRGDFALAIWDGARRRLFCARDPFGVVPFYYARVRNGLACSNTLDCLREHPDVSRALNDQAVADHLIFGSNQEWDTTEFADVMRLPPGHALSCSDGVVQVARYWTLPEPAGYLRYRRPEDYVDQFRELFDRATADRLRTDRAGILMSGGLDSTSVAASAKRVLAAGGASYDLRAYTWVYERLIPDEERHYAGLAARALDIPVQFLVADANLLSEAGGQPSPLELVGTYGRVMLSGLGGDPAVQPDPRYWITFLRRGDLGGLLAAARQHAAIHGRRPPLHLRANLDRWLHRPVWRPVFPGWLRADLVERMQLRARLETVTEEQLSDRSRTGMTSPFWSNLLGTRDPDHTRLPVRMRHPFFDLRLVRYLMAVPPVPWFVNKHILRASLEGVLPDAVRLRPKTPMAAWPHHALALRHGVPAWMEELATIPELGRWIDLQALWEDLHAPARMADHEYQTIVRALMLGRWLRKQGLAAEASGNAATPAAARP